MALRAVRDTPQQAAQSTALRIKVGSSLSKVSVLSPSRHSGSRIQEALKALCHTFMCSSFPHIWVLFQSVPPHV